ncbi:16S rRNA (cytosine(967)-C(5))-methyltransferase RsmB [Endothiovibrio diazotrophicus]
MNPRLVAAHVLAPLLAGRGSLSSLLPPALEKVKAADRGLLQELCYGVPRHYFTLDHLLDRLLERPLKAKEREVRALLLVGLHQMLHLRIPDHAAVGETVAAARKLGKPWAGGLVNGVLRNFQRRRDELLAAPLPEEAELNHPGWLIERLRAAWPGQWREIVAANDRHPPMTLRVNALRGDRTGYARRLTDAAIAARPVPHTHQGLRLDRPHDVTALPGFAEGAVSVQDGAAQLAAELLDPQPGERILDACAAPGGKTGHLLEHQPHAEVTALDSDPERLKRVEENLTRLGLDATVVAADAADTARWWDHRPFDRILLDAPCSATGVIRRHPDIKLLRTPDEVARLVAEQARLLDALWPLLAPGGTLLYATCSVLPEENEAQIDAFLQRTVDAEERPIEAPWGHPRRHGRQRFPGEDDMDGFYYALIGKR